MITARIPHVSADAGFLCAGLLFGGLLLGGAAGCGGGPTAVADGPTGSRDTAEEAAVREQCEPEGRRVEAVDVNNDGTPDIRHVYEGSTERCAQFDMNFDGIVDVTRFFAPDGRSVVREEHDFDFD
jgi:hypothetical protein